MKSKEAHNMIKKELTHHLLELSQSYKKRGFTIEDADEKAIQEMGNPFTIGEKLNSLHKPKMDWILIALFVLFAGISFLPLVDGIPEFSLSSTYFMGRQVIWYALAVLAYHWINFLRLPKTGEQVDVLLCDRLDDPFISPFIWIYDQWSKKVGFHFRPGCRWNHDKHIFLFSCLGWNFQQNK